METLKSILWGFSTMLDYRRVFCNILRPLFPTTILTLPSPSCDDDCKDRHRIAFRSCFWNLYTSTMILYVYSWYRHCNIYIYTNIIYTYLYIIYIHLYHLRLSMRCLKNLYQYPIPTPHNTNSPTSIGEDRALDRELCILSSEWKRQAQWQRIPRIFKEYD